MSKSNNNWIKLSILHIAEWFDKVFMPVYNAKKAPDSKTSGKSAIAEPRVAVTTVQLAEKYREVYGKSLLSKKILQSFIYPLMNNGFIDSVDSDLDKRSNIYFPINMQKNILLFQNEEGNNLLHTYKMNIETSTSIPSKSYMKSQIEPILNYYSKNGKKFSLKSHMNEEMTVVQLVDKYYNNASDYFIGEEISTPDRLIGSSCEDREEYPKDHAFDNTLHINNENDVKSTVIEDNISNKLFPGEERNNFLIEDNEKSVNPMLL